jgi:hypothetical protein
VTGTNAVPSVTTNAAIGNWNHATDRNWHGYIDFIYLWNRVLDLGARRAIQNNPWQFVKPRLSGRTYVAYGITAPTLPRGDSGKGLLIGFPWHRTACERDRRSLFNGHFDEFRVSHIQRSDGWIETTWNNMSNPGAFAAAGPEEQQGGEPSPLAGARVVACLMG